MWIETNTLCLLGDGPLLLSACRQLAGNQQNIFLPGLVHNVADYLRAADLFVSASHAEGMPNAVLEALAASLPVILSDIPAHREVLENCSEAGWLFAPSDPTASRASALIKQSLMFNTTGRTTAGRATF